MPEHPDQHTPDFDDRGKLLRPRVWHCPDRHASVAISHASNDPSRHRAFKIRASFDAARDGWQAYVSQHHHNEQYGDWSLLLGVNGQLFPTPATCLGNAASVLIAAFDDEVLEDQE
jgi:hypothetical protein